MNRSNGSDGSRPGSGRNRERAIGLASHPPAWMTLARHRKPWTRLKMFHWPFTAASPTIDNSIPERVDQGIALFSRALGPMLLVAALAGAAWGMMRWLA